MFWHGFAAGFGSALLVVVFLLVAFVGLCANDDGRHF